MTYEKSKAMELVGSGSEDNDDERSVDHAYDGVEQEVP